MTTFASVISVLALIVAVAVVIYAVRAHRLQGLVTGSRGPAFQDFMPELAHMQSRVMANQFILVELLCDLTKQHDDPSRYLANLYDRVVGRWEQSPMDKNPKGDANFREAVEAVIMKAGE